MPPLPCRVFETNPAWHDDRARGLVSAHRDGVPPALAQIRAWHPAFAGASDATIRRAPFDEEASRLVHAREHGFAGWTEFLAHLTALDEGRADEPFRDTFAALRSGDWRRARALLVRHPELARARGTNGNTLLNLAVSLAGCPGRPLPDEAVAILDLILEASDVDAANHRGWTPLHQAAYSDDAFLARRLLDAGASVGGEAHGAGGTPLAVALFWGHRAVPELLAAVAVVPANLRMAAGLGRTDLIDVCFDRQGELTPAARAGRGFYRPHSGFPFWTPADDRQQILDEALVWAAKADRVAALAALVERGADMNADPYRGTPLMWAAAQNRLEAARWLLDHGATIGRGTFGGPTHGEGVTPLHLAAQNNHCDVVQLLLERGADRAVKDALYDSTPAGWARHEGSADALEALTSFGA